MGNIQKIKLSQGKERAFNLEDIIGYESKTGDELFVRVYYANSTQEEFHKADAETMLRMLNDNQYYLNSRGRQIFVRHL